MATNAKEHGLPWHISIDSEKSAIMSKFTILTHKNYFESLLSNLGASSLSTGFTHNYSSNSTIAYFSFNWYTPQKVHTISWSLNMRSEKLAGPIQTLRPVANLMGSKSGLGNSVKEVSTASSVYESKDWAGYEFYTGSTVSSTSANFNVANIIMPPSSQVNTSANQVATVWVGLSNQAGGVGGLAQTGYATDATPGSNSYNYNLWYEVYDPGTPVNMASMTDYNGNPTVSPGNIVSATVQQSGSSWDFEIYNYNNSNTYTASHSMVYLYIFNYQFSAYYNQYVVEAYATNNIIQQIAEFYPAINFEGGTLYSNGATQFVTNLYNSSSYNEYLLYQTPSNLNVDTHYFMQTGTYDTSLFGYSVNSWLNSYDS